jgi:hypothetical protein
MARRRKEERRAGSASRGMVRRWARFSSRVRQLSGWGLLVPEPTHGRSAAKVWRLCTPAMAAGLTDHVWSLEEVLCYRVPPWPQPPIV